MARDETKKDLKKELQAKVQSERHKPPAGGVSGPAGDRLALLMATATEKEKERMSERTRTIAEEVTAARKKRADGRF